MHLVVAAVQCSSRVTRIYVTHRALGWAVAGPDFGENGLDRRGSLGRLPSAPRSACVHENHSAAR